MIQEKENYIVDVDVDNFEKNLHYTINNIVIGDSDLLNDSLYTNVDDTWEYPII